MTPSSSRATINALINFAQQALTKEKYDKAVQILEKAYIIAQVEGLIPLQQNIEEIIEKTIKNYSTECKDLNKIIPNEYQETFSKTLKRIKEPELYI